RTIPTREPAQTGLRRIWVKADAQPHVILGYHLQAYPNPDHPVYYALAQLLAGGTTSRLYKALVEKKKLATSVDSGQDYPGERYGSLFVIEATPRYPHTSDEVIRAIHAETDKLKKGPISDWEVEKVRSSVDVGLLNTLQTNAG